VHDFLVVLDLRDEKIIFVSNRFMIYALCLEHEGGGHRNAGTCQIENDKYSEVLRVLTKRINQYG
jgi:nanoRNase/pAp phosphatase (c-di-AMP/oligoRNAs hydrolase)